MLTIDLDAVAANFRLVAGKLSGARLGAVVKADAYSLGLEPIARTLAASGCADFFVADATEGMALRALLPADRIFVLNGPAADALAEFSAHRLIPVLNDLAQVALWAGHVRAGGTGQAALHVDSGITRLGLPPSEVDALAREPERLAGVALACVMSHLACADEPGHPANLRQLESFAAARAKLPPAEASLANSAAVFLGRQYHFDLVRAGGALYGLAPFETRPNPMAAVIRLEAPILQVRDVDSPMTVGYGASYRVAQRGRIATIPIGYADGFMRSLSNRGSAFLGGYRVPVVGRVSMDLVTLDVSEVPAALAVPGAPVEVIGPNHTVDELAGEAGTIGHEILTSLGHRYVRRHVGGPHSLPGDRP
ncbi:MAG: alanine racemase [Alphaproteobacteria bacterium]